MSRSMTCTSRLGCICIFLLAWVQTASSGIIFTDEAAFLAAVTDPLVATEDFEGFVEGPVANPLTIMAGAAAILDDQPIILRHCRDESGSRILPDPLQMCTDTTHRFKDLVQKSQNPLGISENRIEGSSGQPLEFTALGLQYSHESSDTFLFRSSGGENRSAPLPASPNLETLSFIGWVAAPGELLISVEHQSGGLVLDNMQAFAQPIPEPSAFVLAALGLLSISPFLLSRRRARGNTLPRLCKE